MFDHLFQPVTIGNLKFKNRLFMTPTQSCTASGRSAPKGEGFVTDLTLEFYERRVKGGWGLVPVEISYIRKEGTPYLIFLGADKEEKFEGLGKLADIMHKHRLPACLQLLHAGRGGIQKVTGLQPLSVSNTPPEGTVIEWPPWGGNKPRAMTIGEVEELIQCYVQATVRAKKAGFDMVLFQGCHGFLPCQFQSPYTNHRTDKYGEPTRFLVELITAARAAVGKDFVLGLRANGDDYLEGGLTLKMALKYIPKFVGAGLDWVDVSAGGRENQHWSIQPIYFPHGCIVHLAEAVKKVVDVPVVTAGKINDPQLADDIIAQGRADIVSMCRAAVSDPEFPLKAQEGKLEEIRKCMGCDWCIEGMPIGALEQAPIMCSNNYDHGRYRAETALKPAAKPKKIMVIGGGVSGMEFALTASIRGHDVTLYEKEKYLGGTIVSMASKIPNLDTSDLMNPVTWRETQLKKGKIKVVMGTEVTQALVEKQKPDAVVLATGALPPVAKIPGIDGSNVIVLDDYLKQPKVGQRVAVIGAWHGIETAVSLAKEGKTVTVIDEVADVFAAAPYIKRRRGLTLLEYTRQMKPGAFNMLLETKVSEINKYGVTVVNKEGKGHLVEADTVIVALDRVANDGLKKALESRCKEVYLIGDCAKPSHVLHAIHSGARLAREI